MKLPPLVLPAHAPAPAALVPTLRWHSTRCRARNLGQLRPTDRGKPGTKRHLVVDGRGTPLGVTLSGANRHDSMALAATLDAMPAVRSGKRGRPRRRPRKLHADKAYDSRRCRQKCRKRGIKPRIARKGRDSSQRLSQYRWVVERTHA